MATISAKNDEMRKKRPDPIKSVQRRLEVEAKLAEYPELTSDKVIDLIYWFKREATAMEVATVASNPDIQDSYRQFRDRHLDKLSTGEIFLATGLGMILIVVVAIVIAVP